MKKKFLIAFLTFVMMLSSAVPVMAASREEIIISMAIIEVQEAFSMVDYIEIIPMHERTRIYFTNFNGVLHFRVWGITSGRWLTEWQPA